MKFKTLEKQMTYAEVEEYTNSHRGELPTGILNSIKGTYWIQGKLQKLIGIKNKVILAPTNRGYSNILFKHKVLIVIPESRVVEGRLTCCDLIFRTHYKYCYNCGGKVLR